MAETPVSRELHDQQVRQDNLVTGNGAVVYAMMEAFLQGNRRIEEEQEKLVICVKSKQVLLRVGFSYITKRQRTFWLGVQVLENNLGIM